ncbi:MAG: hypothetical protein ACRDY6_19525 [Acidimicrobiia bacterium]
MSEVPPVSEVIREVLKEMLERPADALDRAGGTAASSNGHDRTRRSGPAALAPPQHADPIPVVPAPPVAAVHRPSSWSRRDESPPVPVPTPEPAARTGAPAEAAPLTPEPLAAAAAEDARADTPSVSSAVDGVKVEQVELSSDADLDAFVRRLLRLAENPRDRMALRAGQLKFVLRPPRSESPAAPTLRIERGAVTERMIDEVAGSSSMLVLGPAAVLTPLARDRARRLGVAIEKEKRC